jgi:hypothetical protein
MRLRRFIAGGLVAASALIVPLSSAAHADVNDIKIGNRSQFSQITGRPQTLVFKPGRFVISGR